MATNAYTKAAIAQNTGGRQGPVIVPTLATRRVWAESWSVRIANLLNAPMKHGALSRIFRLRFFQDDDYIVASILQTFGPPRSLGAEITSKLAVFVVRPYYRAMGDSSAVIQHVHGDYSTDEVVAFLRLDLVNPDAADWRDETKYVETAPADADLVRSIAEGVH